MTANEQPVTAGTLELSLDPLPGLVGYRLRRAQSALFARFRERFADLDIRPALLGILTVVANNPGLKQSELSEALAIAPTNLVPLLAELERRGLIDRGPAPTDRRSRALTLTADGAVLLAECHRRERQLETAIADRLGAAARDDLLALLRRVEAACREI